MESVVEFEHSINAAVNRLRQVLGDSAEDPLDWGSFLALSPDGTRFAWISGLGKPLQILSAKGEVLAEMKVPDQKG